MKPDPALPPLADPERALVLAYANRRARDALGLLWRLDEQLGRIVASTTTPVVGQMRLTWWHDALIGLGAAPAPAEPLLAALAETREIEPEKLLPILDGWERLLDPLPLAPEVLQAYAEERGATLFVAAATVLGGAAGVDASTAGRRWALVDLAFHVSDAVTARRALDLAQHVARLRSWPRALRPLAILDGLARRDAEAGVDRPRRAGSPARMVRIMLHGLTGL